MRNPTWYNFLICLLILIPCGIIDLFSNSKWFCNFWGWHKAPTNQGWDGGSFNGTCPRCDKEVMQDGQGNWF